MNLTVYHLKTCDTCRKAIRALRAAGHDLTLIDVRADGVPAHVLEAAIKQVGRDKLLNTRSATWRGLSEADKTNITDKKAVVLMTEYPTLIKRPLINAGTVMSTGWAQDVQAQYL